MMFSGKSDSVIPLLSTRSERYGCSLGGRLERRVGAEGGDSGLSSTIRPILQAIPILKHTQSRSSCEEINGSPKGGSSIRGAFHFLCLIR